MIGLSDQVRELVGERAPDLVVRREVGPLAATAVVAAAVAKSIDPTEFETTVVPALFAVLERDRDAAARAEAPLGDLLERNGGYGDPDSPGAAMGTALTTVMAAVRMTTGSASASEVVAGWMAVWTLVEVLGEVEALPEVSQVEFADLVVHPDYMVAPVPVAWREAARTVRALRLVDEHDDPWGPMLQEADVLGAQIKALADTLTALRGPVSQAHPTINDFDFDESRATALRTAPAELVDVEQALRVQVEVWLERLRAFDGFRRQGPTPPIPPSAVRRRDLVIGVPPGARDRAGSLFDELARTAGGGTSPVSVRFVEVG